MLFWQAKTLLNGGAPAEMLARYFELVEEPEHRLLLFSKARMHTQAVQTLIELKDRSRLEKYYQVISGGWRGSMRPSATGVPRLARDRPALSPSL